MARLGWIAGHVLAGEHWRGARAADGWLTAPAAGLASSDFAICVSVRSTLTVLLPCRPSQVRHGRSARARSALLARARLCSARSGAPASRRRGVRATGSGSRARRRPLGSRPLLRGRRVGRWLPVRGRLCAWCPLCGVCVSRGGAGLAAIELRCVAVCAVVVVVLRAQLARVGLF